MTGHEIGWLTWIGAALLSVCGLPQAIKAKRSPRSTRGLSWVFLWTWLVGEAAMFVGMMRIASVQVELNYFLNIWLIAYVCMVKARQC